MKISLNWLSEFVKVDIPTPELLERLAMIGLEAENAGERDGDTIIELETYANRPDTLGHLGVAREVAAMLGEKLVEKTWPIDELSEKISDLTDVRVYDEALCPRYCAMLIKGVKVGPSPDWLRRRIEAMGLRPINNIVDVSNYVLFATAQPLHTFDFAKLQGGRIIVRKAQKGETLKTLEGTTIELSPEMLVIADEARPVALAGVIGGAETAVTESTQDVFIESACFDPISIRLTAKKAGLSTDASYRFERGSDILFAPRAALMAASLLCGFGGRAAQGILDVYSKPWKPKSVILRYDRIPRLLGVDVPDDRVLRILEDLGFKVEESRKGIWRVGVPSFRIDIEREADLIEEVARFYGYDRIPCAVTPLKSFEPPVNKKRERVQKGRQVLLHQGLDEVINFSFSDPEKELIIASGREPIPIRNPLSSRLASLRTSLIMGLLENAVWNLNRGLEGVHIFEFGNIYFRKDGAHQEQFTLGLLTTGLSGRPHWQTRPGETDFFALKGAVEALMSALKYEPYSFTEAGHPFFEEGASLALIYKGETVGHLGVLKRTLRGLYSLEGTVYAAEINLASLMEKQPKPFRFIPVARFPGVSRDLSFLADRNLSYQDIRTAVAKLSIPFLADFELTDRFSGPSIPGDKISLSIRFHYQNPNRTLQAEEVDKAQEDIIGHLKGVLKIQLREGRKN